jgi:hypothetical protein
MSTLSLTLRQHQQNPDERNIDFEDRVKHERYLLLDVKKKKTPAEKKEYEELEKEIGIRHALWSGRMPETCADLQVQPLVERLHRELSDLYGRDTVAKRVLIDRLAAAWSMAWSYERMFRCTKYVPSEDDTTAKFDCNPEKTRYLKEVRQGIESANDQILRLTQALQNICNPPIQVKAKNAFFAQNQQINQGIPPKDLADSSGSPHANSLSH